MSFATLGLLIVLLMPLTANAYTLQLSTIDVAATEKANNETAGSLQRRLQKSQPPAIEQKTVSGRTVTNTDLESFRSKRVASEAAYEKKLKELGLPSAEGLRRESLSISERTHQQLLSIQTEERQAESYWRNRAAELRAELAAVSARISFVQARLNELPLN